jgi:hypothetical protein
MTHLEHKWELELPEGSEVLGELKVHLSAVVTDCDPKGHPRPEKASLTVKVCQVEEF